MASQRTTRQIIQDAFDTLFTARLGLKQMLGADPKARMAGLRNVVVFGRATTNVLQNLRATEPDFDSWYQPHVEAMKSDALLKYFYELRSRILKEGTLGTSSSLRISGNPHELMRRFEPPPGATSFFICDTIGGTGWEVQNGDGSVEKYYVDVPSDVPGVKLEVKMHFF